MIGQAVGHRHCQRHDPVPAVDGQEPAIWRILGDRDDLVAAILVPDAREAGRDQRGPAATAAAFPDDLAEAIAPEAATDREGRVVMAIDQGDPVAAIALEDRVMETATDRAGRADPAMVIAPVARVIGRVVPVRVVAANNGGRVIDRAVPAIDPIGRIDRIIVRTAVQTGTSGRIGGTTVGPT